MLGIVAASMQLVHHQIELSPITGRQDDIPQAEVQWLARPYQTGDLEGAKLVFACTDQAEVNRQIMEDAAPSQLVNNTGDKTFSVFYNVAIARKKDVSVMISTNGLSPSRSKEIRKKIEAILDQL